MNFTKLIYVLLSSFLLAIIYACTPQPEMKPRQMSTSRGADDAQGSSDNSSEQDDDDDDNDNEDDDDESSSGEFSMSWDDSGDANIVSYKIFFIPPDSGTRTYKNASGTPIEIKNYPLASLELEGGKYSVEVEGSDIDAAIGTLQVDEEDYCFSLVAVNAVGNSVHSAKVCPNQ